LPANATSPRASCKKKLIDFHDLSSAHLLYAPLSNAVKPCLIPEYLVISHVALATLRVSSSFIISVAVSSAPPERTNSFGFTSGPTTKSVRPPCKLTNAAASLSPDNAYVITPVPPKQYPITAILSLITKSLDFIRSMAALILEI